MLDNNLKISLSLQPLCNELKYLQKTPLNSLYIYMDKSDF